ncbi:hypothetical protein F4806DRAFT_483955 [Annulohypoxylon nitens]|nr:hypothetical protein F4806DRAFT_483955 [Annulohypoxylon nitens]
MAEVAIRDVDQQLLNSFHTELARHKLEECDRCSRRWFDIDLVGSVCRGCRDKAKNPAWSQFLFGRQQARFRGRTRVPARAQPGRGDGEAVPGSPIQF